MANGTPRHIEALFAASWPAESGCIPTGYSSYSGLTKGIVPDHDHEMVKYMTVPDKV